MQTFFVDACDVATVIGAHCFSIADIHRASNDTTISGAIQRLCYSVGTECGGKQYPGKAEKKTIAQNQKISTLNGGGQYVLHTAEVGSGLPVAPSALWLWSGRSPIISFSRFKANVETGSRPAIERRSW